MSTRYKCLDPHQCIICLLKGPSTEPFGRALKAERLGVDAEHCRIIEGRPITLRSQGRGKQDEQSYVYENRGQEERGECSAQGAGQ